MVVVVVCVLLAGAVSYAYLAIFSTYMTYDDEGYMMISVREFNAGGALYDEVFSTYGPSYYLYYWTLFGAGGLPLTHDVNRLVTVAHWMAIAALLAWFAFRATRLPLLAVLVFLQSVYHLTPLTHEPGHPHGFCLMLIAIALAVSTLVQRPERHPANGRPLDRGAPMTPAFPAWLAPFAVLGFLSAWVALAKINLGAFMFMALAGSLVLHLKPRPVHIALGLLTWALILAGPAALMWRNLLEVPWIQYYCVVVTLSLAALAVAGLRGTAEARALDWRALIAAATGAFAGTVLVLAFVLARGTSLHGLFQGVILRPLAFPGLFIAVDRLSPYGMAIAGASFALAAIYAVTGRFLAVPERYAVAALAAARLALACAILTSSLLSLGNPYRLDDGLNYYIAFAWLVLAPVPNSQTGGASFARTLLAAMTVLLALQTYPIFGTQRVWSTVLLVPVASVCLRDAWAGLRTFGPRRRAGGSKERALACLAASLLLAVAYLFWAGIPGMSARYKAARPLRLPGAKRLRLDSETVAALRWMTERLREEAGVFVTLPGYNSLYFWTGIEPPAGYNVTAWPSLLTAEEQQQTVDALRQAENACALVHRDEAERLVREAERKTGLPRAAFPLVHELEANYVTIETYGPYELRKRAGP